MFKINFKKLIEYADEHLEQDMRKAVEDEKQNIIMNKDIQFIKDLQKEMNEQENDGQAAPRYWSIMDYKWEPTSEDHAERMCLYDCEEGEAHTTESYLDDILERHLEGEFTAEEVQELKDAIEMGSDNDVFEWVKDYDNKEQIYPVYETEVSFVAPNTMFLTKEEAKKHLRLNHYHYSKKAHTYAMTAWRAPKMERLINILEQFDWDSVKVGIKS